MKNQLLSQSLPARLPGVEFLPSLSLSPGRLHEFCGFSRRFLAVILARAMEGPVFWIRPARQVERLHGDGMAGLVEPRRFTFVAPHRAIDLLWAMEETLRAGIVPLVICELPGIPGLTPVRRLHLAAEQGRERTGRAPLGVVLLAGEGGAPGVESRWHMAPRAGRHVSWRLSRRRARMQPPGEWVVSRSADGGFRLDRGARGSFPDPSGAAQSAVALSAMNPAS